MENGLNYNRHAIFNDCKNVIKEIRGSISIPPAPLEGILNCC